MSGKRPTVITISRQTASGGAYLGHLLARKLGYRYIEREVLYQAAKDLGADIRELSHQDERKSGFVENLMKGFLFGTPEAGYVPPAGRPVYDRDLFEQESQIIRSVAEQYSTVIVGRGAYWVLRNRPDAVHVFLHAPLEFRIQRYKAFHPGTDSQIRDELQDADRKREKFLKSMTGSDWCDARNYHLCVDVAKAGFDQVQDMVIELLNGGRIT